MKNLNGLLSVLVLSIVSTACGNIQSGQLNSANYGIGSNGGNGLTGAAACASSPNVVGQGYNNSLQNQYRVCNAGSVGNITLYPEDDATKNICVIPVKVVGSQSAVFTQFAKCTTIKASGVSMSFGNLGFNAVYVVDYNAAYQFNRCLAQAVAGGYSLPACASQAGIGGYYAYGQF